MADVDQLAEALFIHAVCDTPVSSITPDVAHRVWQYEQDHGPAWDWRADYRTHASEILARLALLQKQSRPEPADE